MATHATYTHARAHFAALWDRAVENREPIVIQRRGSEAVVLIAEHELLGLLETAHLLRSPRNAERLLRALSRARRGAKSPSSVEGLRRELGLE